VLGEAPEDKQFIIFTLPFIVPPTTATCKHQSVLPKSERERQRACR